MMTNIYILSKYVLYVGLNLMDINMVSIGV